MTVYVNGKKKLQAHAMRSLDHKKKARIIVLLQPKMLITAKTKNKIDLCISFNWRLIIIGV